MAYDEKYRAQAVAFKDSGHSFEELRKVFRIYGAAYYRWKKLKEENGFYAPKSREKLTRKRKVDPEKLKVVLAEKPDAYLRELADMFHCSTVAIYKRLKKLGITLKKRRLPIPKNRKKIERNILKK